MPKFAQKNDFFGYSWARILKQNCHVWNHHPQICLIPKFSKRTKIPEYVTKKALFGYFWDRTLKKYCDIWNHHSQIYEIAKFCRRIKNP